MIMEITNGLNEYQNWRTGINRNTQAISSYKLGRKVLYALHCMHYIHVTATITPCEKW